MGYAGELSCRELLSSEEPLEFRRDYSERIVEGTQRSLSPPMMGPFWGIQGLRDVTASQTLREAEALPVASFWV